MPRTPGRFFGTEMASRATIGQTAKSTPSILRTNSSVRHNWEQTCKFSARRWNPAGFLSDSRNYNNWRVYVLQCLPTVRNERRGGETTLAAEIGRNDLVVMQQLVAAPRQDNRSVLHDVSVLGDLERLADILLDP